MSAPFLGIAAEFTADEADLIDKARGLWTREHFIREAAVYTALVLLAGSTEDERRGAIPDLSIGCPCVGTPTPQNVIRPTERGTVSRWESYARIPV